MDHHEDNDLTRTVIGLAIEVHRHLGPGLLESAYEQCLCFELGAVGLQYASQQRLPIRYKGTELDCSYHLDIVVEGRLIVEVRRWSGLRQSMKRSC